MGAILVTGASRGLGRAACERFPNAVPFHRGDDAAVVGAGVAAVLHCAFESRARPTTFAELNRYLEGNVSLTAELLALGVPRFIYISTIDVYREGDGATPAAAPYREHEEALPRTPGDLYATTKLLAEALVRSRHPRPVILRCAAMIGPHARPNAARRIIEEPNCRLSLSADSEFNYVHHEEVLDLVAHALRGELEGTFNVASSDNVSLAEVAARWGRGVRFGDYRYDAGRIDNTRAVHRFPRLSETSMHVLERHAASLER